MLDSRDPSILAGRVTGAPVSSPSVERLSVLLVGKGPPETGGIPAFLAALQTSALAELADVRFLNLSRGGTRVGGRATIINVVRTALDAADVFRAARTADVVHIHSALAPGVTLVRASALAASARLAGARVVVHAHGGLIQLWLQGRTRRLLASVGLRAADRVVAVSRGAQEALTPSVARGVVLIENGVDVNRFSPAEERERHARSDLPVVAFVGLLTPRKGLLDLFEASSSLIARGRLHRLVVAGGEPDEGGDAAEAVRARAPAHAELVGTLTSEGVVELLRSTDVFCLPSWWEAMPLSLLEAMACGIPVVATAVGDVPRLISHGESGFLVPAKDATALAEALDMLLSAPELRREIGRAGRQRVTASYGLEGTIAGIAATYREVSRKPAPPA